MQVANYNFDLRTCNIVAEGGTSNEKKRRKHDVMLGGLPKSEQVLLKSFCLMGTKTDASLELEE